MILNEEQTKLVGLTMKLELKTKEYHKLCDEFEFIKTQITDPNDECLIPLKERFLQNQKEIIEIVEELKKLNN